MTLIIVGLIGSGKTTLAKSIAGHHHIDFDHEWHERTQPLGCSPLECVARVSEIVRESDKPCVVDGWWTWQPEWWREEGDQTLDALSQVVSEQPIRLLHVATSADEALTAYRMKWLTGQYRGTMLDDRHAYAASIPARQAYLSRKVAEWAR